MPKHLEWIKFNPGDWLSEHSLIVASSAARGAWIQTLAYMARDGKWSFTATVEKWGKLWNATPKETLSILSELIELKVCAVALLDEKEHDNMSAERNVTPRGNADVTPRGNAPTDFFETAKKRRCTLVSRRLCREAKSRELTRLRLRKHRGQTNCNTDVLSDVTLIEIETETETEYLGELERETLLRQASDILSAYMCKCPYGTPKKFAAKKILGYLVANHSHTALAQTIENAGDADTPIWDLIAIAKKVDGEPTVVPEWLFGFEKGATDGSRGQESEVDTK